jgi:glycosyltransferase involved in cell wall biosynthesis
MKRWIERHASLGIACSREAAIALFGLTWEANPRRRILYYGIDLSPFQTVPDSGKIRTELGIPPDALVIGHVGRFSQQKNHAFLIVIFSELIKLQPDAYLLLVGDGELRPDIERRVDEAGLSTRVLFLGSRPDVPSLMKGTVDVFLFPSLYEGLPLVLIEAQAACLPCIIADTVPVEVDIVKPLIRRVGLDTPPAIWAGTLVNHLSSVPTDLKAINVLKGSPFTIESSVSALAEVYGG